MKRYLTIMIIAIVVAAFLGSVQTEAMPSAEEIPFIPTPSTPDTENLIQNGYFLEDYTGWKRELIDEGGSSKIKLINSQNSLFDRALWMEQTGLGRVSLQQQLPISTLDMTFSATFSTSATSGPIIGFSGSGYAIIGIIYNDQNNKSLGFSRILNVNESLFADTAFVGAPEKISDTNSEHNIMIESDKVYKNFELNLSKEINENLLGIDPLDVRSITIVLMVGSTDKKASGSLTISDIVLK